MEISTELLKKMLNEAFDAGYSNSAELKTQLIDEILQSVNQEETERVYTVEELRKMPEGAIFQHQCRGRCWIINKRGKKVMCFETGETMEFNMNNDPWNIPMKLLHIERI